MRLYDGRITVGTAGEPRRLWDVFEKTYDDPGNRAPTTGKTLYITAAEDNSGYIVVGGHEVVAAVGSRQGLPALAPGQTLCFPIDNLDLRYVWFDGTISGDNLYFAYTAEPER